MEEKTNSRRLEAIANYTRGISKICGNSEDFKKFLEFYGKFYKIPTADVIGLYGQSEKCDMLASQDCWESLGREIMQTEKSRVTIGENGDVNHFFDISQTSGQEIPTRFVLDRDTASIIREDFTKQNGKQYENFSELLKRKAYEALKPKMSEYWEKLNIPPKSRKSFSSSLLSITSAITAYRCCLDGKMKYDIEPDISVIHYSKNIDDVKKILTFAGENAKEVLLEIEREVKRIKNERGKQDERDTRENNSSRRSNLADKGQQRDDGILRRQSGEMGTRTLDRKRSVDGDNQTSRVVLSVGSDTDKRPRGTGTLGGRDRVLRQEVAIVDERELSRGSNYPKDELPISDNSKENRQGSRGTGGNSQPGIREKQSTAEPERFFSNSELQGHKGLVRAEQGDEGNSIESTDSLKTSTLSETSDIKAQITPVLFSSPKKSKKAKVSNFKQFTLFGFYEPENEVKPSEKIFEVKKIYEVGVGDFVDIGERQATVIGKDPFMSDRVLLSDNKLQGIMNFSLSLSELKKYGYEFSDKEVVINDKLETPDHKEREKAAKSKNFVITNENLGEGSPREKLTTNIEAIKLVKALEKEKRNATLEEQETLSKYVGWGGLSEVFDERENSSANFLKEREQLKTILTPEEYEKAVESTLTAYYTNPTIIKAMYTALDNFGVPKNAKILEPACGIGNFFGCAFEDTKYNFSGVELDNISASIAKHLYPSAKILNCGFEETNFKNGSFDVALGNVPFSNIGVNDTIDKNLSKNNFILHDYFFAKALEKVAPGGVVAFITSKGTLDKQNSKIREYLAERAELVGAIRLPNNAYKISAPFERRKPPLEFAVFFSGAGIRPQNAGTEVTSDIIFLKKREFPLDISTKPPDWCFVGKTQDNIPINQYFVEHPEMILGKMIETTSRFGKDTTCLPDKDTDFKTQLNTAINNLETVFEATKKAELEEQESGTLPAPLDQRNWTYTVVEGDIYFKQNSDLIKQELKPKAKERLLNMLEVRTALREVIEAQVRGCDDTELSDLQTKLNAVYTNFVSKYGNITDTANQRVFKLDDDRNLLASLEKVKNENGIKQIDKADIFSKRTIRTEVEVTKTDNAEEALFISLDKKGRVDTDYISKLCEKSPQESIAELVAKDKIYFDPAKDEYVLTSEYLSGNVREKLRIAQLFEKTNTSISSSEVEEKKSSNVDIDLTRNVEALKKVIPENIPVSDISVKLGAAFIKTEDYEKFLREKLGGLANSGEVLRGYDGEYKIKKKGLDCSVNSTSIHGTKRMNMYEILECMLNQRDPIVRDKFTLPDGKITYKINPKKTDLAMEKAKQMQENFVSWLWENPKRREFYVKTYNETFNSIVCRKFDGSHQSFPGMSPDIHLREHQKNAIERAKFGGNSLFAHVVGAGKSFEMYASIMEKKRLGLINKAVVVVPKALTGQTALEWQRLYPNAKLLVAGKKDFTKENRNKFVARLTTGNYDAVIMSYEQFEKMPMSEKHREEFIRKEIEKITTAIKSSSNSSVKDLQRKKKQLHKKLDKFLSAKKRDSAIDFEQTGIDMIAVDEAHNYKNGLIISKIRNVAGVGGTAAGKCEDMLMKCNYLNEKHGYNRLIFATGTPISNSMSELYTMSMYLRPDLMREAGISNFDDWAATFAKINVQMEPSAGGGYKPKKRLNEFVNLPELIQIFHEFADVKNAEDLNLPTPELETGKSIAIVAKPSEFQLEYITELAKRSKEIQSRCVDPHNDNCLKITNEARLLGLDSRTINLAAEVTPDCKINLLIDNVEKIYHETTDKKGVQAIFSDIAVNSDDGKFSVYKHIKEELIKRGIPENEICFASDANDDKARNTLFAQLRNGEKRIVIASTAKLGTGANIQTRLAAVHHADIPWKPSDLEQRNGRILRQGNTFDKVKIFNYVTEKTFDSYLMNIIVNKQKFISQLMSGKKVGRTCRDMGDTVLNYAEIQALASGDPRIKEKIDLEADLSRLKVLKNSFSEEKYRLQSIIENNTEEVKNLTVNLKKAETDKEKVIEKPKITLNSHSFAERKDTGEYLETILAQIRQSKDKKEIGKVGDFTLQIEYIGVAMLNTKPSVRVTLSGELEYSCDLSFKNPLGNVT